MKQMASYYGQNNIRVNSIFAWSNNSHVKGTKKRQDKIFKKNYFNKIP